MRGFAPALEREALQQRQRQQRDVVDEVQGDMGPSERTRRKERAPGLFRLFQLKR